jgi:hypothetical protein
MTDLQLPVPACPRSSVPCWRQRCLASSETNLHKILKLCSPETRIRDFHRWMLSRSYSLKFLFCGGNVRKLSLRNIFVCNLDFKVSEKQLQSEFAQFGAVEPATIMRDSLPASCEASGLSRWSVMSKTAIRLFLYFGDRVL